MEVLIMTVSSITAIILLAFALLGAAAVYGTDVFFWVVETMGRFHEIADRRMPIFGVIGIVGALASVAFSRVSWPWALSAVAAQVLWIVVYRRVAAPVKAELTRQARAGSVPPDARAFRAGALMGFAVIALAAASNAVRGKFVRTV
jgi:hypothetical protein